MAPLTNAQIAQALEQKAGNIAQAAKALGVTRQTLYNRIQKSTQLAQTVVDEREGMVDIAESALRREVINGNITAIIFTLKTLGKERGYVERQEITGADGGPLRFTADDANQAKRELDEWQEKKSNGSSAAKA